MIASNIKKSFIKLQREDIQLRKKALIMTTLDRFMIEHPVQYCKALNEKKYKQMLNQLVKSGLISQETILKDE